MLPRLSLLPVFFFATISFAADLSIPGARETLIHEDEAFSIFRGAADSVEGWCQSPEPQVAVFYDVSHEQRLGSLGQSYDSFVRNVIVPKFRETCGSDPASSRIRMTMHNWTEASSILTALNGFVSVPNPWQMIQGHYWDAMTYSIDGSEIRAVDHGAGTAMAQLNLSPEEVQRFAPASLSKTTLAVKTGDSSKLRIGGAKDTLIYQDEGLWIFRSELGSQVDWCNRSAPQVAVFYDVPHERRLERLGQNYDSFVENVVVPTFRELCGAGPRTGHLSVTMHNWNDAAEIISSTSRFDSAPNSWRRAQSYYWDAMTYTVNEASVTAVDYKSGNAMAPHNLTAEEKQSFAPLSWLEPMIAAMEQRRKRLAEGPCNSEGCDFGPYLNDIYNGDVDALRRFDQANRLPASTLRLFRPNALAVQSLLSALSMAYIDDMPCLFGDVRSLTRLREITPTTAYIMMPDGMLQEETLPGFTYRYTHVFKAEFEPVCEKVCGHLTGDPRRNLNVRIRLAKIPGVFRTLKEIKELNCDLPERRAFEQRFLAMMLLYMDNESIWFEPPETYPIPAPGVFAQSPMRQLKKVPSEGDSGG